MLKLHSPWEEGASLTVDPVPLSVPRDGYGCEPAREVA
jgi:hypothetical protein